MVSTKQQHKAKPSTHVNRSASTTIPVDGSRTLQPSIASAGRDGSLPLYEL